MDGYSIDILYRDFRYALEQRLESTKASFRNFIEYAEGSQQESSREFWTQKLADMEPCLFPTYGTRQSGQGTMYVQVPGLEGVQIHAFCAQREMTLATLIQTAWAIVLHRLSGGQNMEPCFGTIMSSRDTPVDDITEIFGPVMCLVPTHVQLNKRSSILETMADVHEEYIGKLPHQTYPVMDLYEEIRGDSQLPFNTALSIVRGDGAVEPVEAGNGAILRFHEARDPVEYDVYVRALDERNKLTIELELWEDRISPSLGTRAAHLLGQILSSIVSSPEKDLQIRSCQSYVDGR